MTCPRCGSSDHVVPTPRGASNPFRCRACMLDFTVQTARRRRGQGEDDGEGEGVTDGA